MIVFIGLPVKALVTVHKKKTRFVKRVCYITHKTHPVGLTV